MLSGMAHHATSPTHYDIIIIGGGPVGLGFATALKDSGLRLCVLEKQAEKALANPIFDGRDIALTHSAIKILDGLGILRHLGSKALAPIRQARVLNGVSSYALDFDSHDDGKEALGYLVSNHLIRKAVYDVARKQKNLDLRTGVEVTGLQTGEAENSVHLSNGQTVTGTLVIAADSRFSATRRMMGIPVAMRDFGRTVIVCRMIHQIPHEQIAHECFHYGRTLAVLPLNGNVCSVVITLPSDHVAELLALPAKEFSAEIAERFENRLGARELVGERHSYPLVATYADRFVGHRFALLGDAAVGMHPVTAHGYNFGLYGAQTLAREIRKALSLGMDIGDTTLLDTYNHAHRKITLPLYHGTNTIVSLFTDERPAARQVRSALLHIGNMAKPIKQLITRQLTQTALAG